MPIYNPVSLPAASAAKVSRLVIDSFLGADLTSAAAGVDPVRSPDCENMIRNVPGKVRKRMGWQTQLTLAGSINGCWQCADGALIVHAGTALYRVQPADAAQDAGGDAAQTTDAQTTDTQTDAQTDAQLAAEQLAQGLADRRSGGWLLGGRLIIADGAQLWSCDGKSAAPAAEGAYLPTVTIGRAPDGGGSSYEGLNLINPRFTEQFLGTADAKRYQLSFAPLDDAPITVQLLQSDGSWKTLSEDTDFSADRAAGALTFVTPPGESPLDGQDNLKITAARTVEGYADRVGRCRIGTLYGVGGASDRLFLSGNPDYPNRDWYSGYNDPTYWDDGAFAVLGREDSAIMGYSILSGLLAAHKDGREPERAIILRQGNLSDGQAAFTVTGSLQGPGAVSRWAFGYLVSEPLFLSKLGVYAVTSQDITGERISSLRSFYLNGKLLEELGLEDAFAFVHKDLYWLCLNGRAYILDGLQPVSADKSAPYSTRQYAGFYCTGIPARVMWEQDGALWFGTADGRLCRFHTDPSALVSYSDDGAPITARWRTPDLAGGVFYRDKTFSRFYLSLARAPATGFAAFVRVRGVWRQLMRDAASARYFSYANLTYSKFTYSNDDNPRTAGGRIRIRRCDRAGFCIENSECSEPFALDALALEFIEGGYHKGG